MRHTVVMINFRVELGPFVICDRKIIYNHITFYYKIEAIYFVTQDAAIVHSYELPYFPVYKRPFLVQNFHFKNRGSLTHGSKSFSTSMYYSSVCRYAL